MHFDDGFIVVVQFPVRRVDIALSRDVRMFRTRHGHGAIANAQAEGQPAGADDGVQLNAWSSAQVLEAFQQLAIGPQHIDAGRNASLDLR